MADFVLIHGVNGVAHQWEPVVRILEESHTVTALDLPALDSAEAVAEWVSERIPEAGIVVGHSFGGVVAQALLEQHPEKCLALVLVNASLRADPPERVAERLARLESMTSEERYVDSVMSNVSRVYHPDRLADETLMRDRRSAVSEYGLKKFKAHTTALISRIDRTDVVKRSSLPVLVVAASEDQVVPSVEQGKWAADIDALFLQIPRTGHMLPSEDPVTLGQAVKLWADSMAVGRHPEAHDGSARQCPQTIEA